MNERSVGAILLEADWSQAEVCQTLRAAYADWVQEHPELTADCPTCKGGGLFLRMWPDGSERPACGVCLHTGRVPTDARL